MEKYINIELSVLRQVWWMISFCRDSLVEEGKLRKYYWPFFKCWISIVQCYCGVPEIDKELPSFSPEWDINVLFLFQHLPDLNDGTFLKSIAFILEKLIWERAHRKPFKTGHLLKKKLNRKEEDAWTIIWTICLSCSRWTNFSASWASWKQFQASHWCKGRQLTLDGAPMCHGV